MQFAFTFKIEFIDTNSMNISHLNLKELKTLRSLQFALDFTPIQSGLGLGSESPVLKLCPLAYKELYMETSGQSLLIKK